MNTNKKRIFRLPFQAAVFMVLLTALVLSGCTRKEETAQTLPSESTV